MKPSFSKTDIIHSIHAIWFALVVGLFILYSGRTSYIYGSSLNNWGGLLSKLTKMDTISFTKNLSLSFAGMLCFVIACISLGSVFTKSIWQAKKLPLTGWLCNITTSFLVGEIIYSLILLGLGIPGKLSPLASTVVVSVGSLTGVLYVKRLYLAYQKQNKNETIKRNLKAEDVIFWILITIILSTSLLASARLSYDSVALYFSNAKLTAISHQIQSYMNDSFVVSSFHIGVLYTAIIQLFGDQAARLFSWMNGVFIIIICMGLAEQTSLSRTGKTITIALLATSTAFLDLFGDGKIELATTLPALAAVYWLINAKKSARASDYLLVGIFSGFAMITRPYNAVLLGGFIGIYYIANKDSLLSFVKSFLWIAGPVAALLAAHLIANWMILGDPIAPINNTLKVNTGIWQWSFDPQQIWVIRAFYPLVATFINTAQSLGNISPLIIAFLPALLLKQSKVIVNLNVDLRKITIIATFVLVAWIMAYFTVLEIRYVLFLWAIIYLAVAEAISGNLEHMNPVNKIVFQGIFIILLLFVFGRNMFIAVDAYAPIDKNNIPHCGDFIFCNFLDPVNEIAKPGERVLALNAFRYYLRPELFACSSKNIEYIEIRDASLASNEAFWLEIHRQGYTYITYERNYAVRHLYMNVSPDPENTPAWLKLERLIGEENDSFVSYRIHYINPPYSMEKICLQSDGGWLVQEIP
ncbi:MAG: glycosyltransferase family 39 protein [Chloroflexota bacterium]